MLGATIHDVAQVVGAGYAVSDTVGNTAVIVKLFRVFLLLPVVLGDRLVVRAQAARPRGAARVPVPVFAFVFLALCIAQQRAAVGRRVAPLYAPIKAVAGRGLDLGPADRDRRARARHLARRRSRTLGWRHIATVDAHHAGDPRRRRPAA